MNKKTSQAPQASLEEKAIEGWDLLKKFQGPILGVLGVSTLLVVFMAYRSSEDKSKNVKAWNALYQAEKAFDENASKKDEEKEEPKFDKVLKDFKNHPVEPFALIKQADVLYQKGSKDDLEKALGLLEDFQKKYSKKLDLYKDLVDRKIAAIKAEIADDKSWLPKKEEKKKDDHDHDGDGKPDHDEKDHKDEKSSKEVEHDHDGDGKPDHGPGEHGKKTGE
ncbi:MAG: hypothetical protein P1V97_12640 [Planctomycetota bacterium]|nr:hypothetical protein [Planctomycetota bacterium]